MPQFLRVRRFSRLISRTVIPSSDTSGKKVYGGHSDWPERPIRLMKVDLGRCGCCTFLLHLGVALTLKCHVLALIPP